MAVEVSELEGREPACREGGGNRNIGQSKVFFSARQSLNQHPTPQQRHHSPIAGQKLASGHYLNLLHCYWPGLPGLSACLPPRGGTRCHTASVSPRALGGCRLRYWPRVLPNGLCILASFSFPHGACHCSGLVRARSSNMYVVCMYTTLKCYVRGRYLRFSGYIAVQLTSWPRTSQAVRLEDSKSFAQALQPQPLLREQV